MKKIEIQTLLEYKFLSAPTISPDGKYTAFVVSQADVKENNYPAAVFLLDNNSKTTRKLTAKGSVANLFWLNDSTLIFSSSRDEKIKEKVKNGEEITCYYSIDITGGEAQLFEKIELLSGKLSDIGNNQFVTSAVYDINRPSLVGKTDLERKEILKEYKERGYTVFEEVPFWGNGQGVVSRKRNRIYIYDRKEKNYEAITPELFNVSQYDVTDGKILYAGAQYDDIMPIKESLYIYDIKTKETKCVIEPNVYAIRHFSVGKDKAVLCMTKGNEFGMNQNADVYVLDLNTLSFELVAQHGVSPVGSNSVNSDALYGGGKATMLIDNMYYYLTTVKNNSSLNSIDLSTGEIERLTSLDDVQSFDIFDDKVFMVAQEESTLNELYILEDGEEKKLTSFNSFVESEYSVSKPEALTAQNGSLEIYGYVLKPKDYVKGNSYPAILHIHGGPKTVFSNIFHHEMQMWANEGYFVIYCNPRGSDGRGDEFADIRAKYGSIDYDDIMAFCDKALYTYEDIDKNRVGVTGGSYGGFMTNWIIGHTDRFKCACAQRCISNWASFEGTTDIGYFFAPDQVGASHMDDSQKQWAQSPLKYADKVKTPTLFIHSDEDYRCHMAEALQMFTALKMHDVPARLCLLKGDNHNLSRNGKPRNRVKRMEEIVSWMNKYLK